MSVLTLVQESHYTHRGYLLVSGLISPQIAADAEEAMWRLLNADPRDPTTWEGIPPSHHSYEEPALLACYTPELLAAAAMLAGESHGAFHAPDRAYAINVFPRSGEWQWPAPHIDHAIKEHGHKVFPRAFRVAGMAYLSDVPPHGGGTIVWPGSHIKLEQLARSDPARYETMWALNQDLASVDLGDPVELTPKRGDVLFYHYLCAHAGSRNTSDRPRLALNMKW